MYLPRQLDDLGFPGWISIRNFQGDRGVVVGLLKGFIGLSGAIFTQVYTAVYAPHTGPFLLLCAVVPPLVALLSMFIIRPVDVPQRKDDNDKSRFSFLYVSFLALRVHANHHRHHNWQAGCGRADRGGKCASLVLGDLSQWQASSKKAIYLPLPTSSDSSLAASSSSAPASASSVTTTSPGMERTTSSSTLGGLVGIDLSKQRRPKLGQDHTLPQAVLTQDYWLLFIAMGCGTGSGLTAINNLGQMAESLGSNSVGAFVALVSVWNFLGRMGAGYVSEYYVKRNGTPRPLFMLLVQALMGCAHLLFATAALVGVAHGAHWTLMVATASELFGLKHFGALYNTLSISATVGSYCLSVKLAGYIYDRQVAAEGRAAAAAGLAFDGLHKCTGPQCFRPTFLIMASICCFGVLILMRLVVRTRRVYQVPRATS
eukprot:jgi/Mesen1/2528/ME000161S01583